MARLLNHRRESFAKLRASGMPRMQAMAEAGYVAAEANARRLDNSADIRARISELYKQHAEFLNADIARVLIEQTRIAYSNMGDFWEKTPEGALKLKDISTLPRELTACIREVKIGKDGEPTIKLHDKVGALQALQRYLDPDPLPPGQKAAPTQPEMPAYDADDDWRELAKPQPVVQH